MLLRMDKLSCEPLHASALFVVAACLCCAGHKGTSADTAGAAESASSTASASAGATSPQSPPTASASPAPTARWCDSVPRREFTGLRRVRADRAVPIPGGHLVLDPG